MMGMNKFGTSLAWLALVVAATCAASLLLAGPAYRIEALSLRAAFGLLQWATFGAMGAALVALLAWSLLTWAKAPRGRRVAGLALVLGLTAAATPLALYLRAKDLPPIHDISTDMTDPPAFVAVLPLRQGARNSVDVVPETLAQQKRGYPDIAPLRLKDVPPAEAFARAERTARAMGWQIVAVAPDALRIEATDTTLFFGFKDDIVIRVRPEGSGSIVDMRSLSRVGTSDVGVNAKRIRNFLARLSAG